MLSVLFSQISCCICDWDSFSMASSCPALVSHGDKDTHLSRPNILCSGIAQSYLDGKLHITATAPMSFVLCRAVNTLLAMAWFPNPPTAVHTYSMPACSHKRCA